MEFSTWTLPTGLSANKNVDMPKRMKHYRLQQVHSLRNGKRIIPKIETIKHIFQAYDEFNLEVAISDGSFTLFSWETYLIHCHTA